VAYVNIFYTWIVFPDASFRLVGCRNIFGTCYESIIKLWINILIGISVANNTGQDRKQGNHNDIKEQESFQIPNNLVKHHYNWTKAFKYTHQGISFIYAEKQKANEYKFSLKLKRIMEKMKVKCHPIRNNVSPIINVLFVRDIFYHSNF
jgi:hypothetical protein